MPDTTMSPTLPASSGGNENINVSAANSAAVSEAISQSGPPKTSTAQEPAKINTSVREVNANNALTGDSDKVISLDEFDEEGESNKEVKKVVSEKTKNNKNEETENEELETSSNEEKEDKSLKLDLSLDENIASKLEKEKEKIDSKNTSEKQKRDYSKFRPEHQEFLKDLPNKSFAKASEELSKIYQTEQEVNKLKEQVKNSLQGKLPENYYEHPDAFKLSPDYSKLSNDLELTNFESQHWQAQLLNIKRGQPWINLKGYNKTTGQPVFERIEAQKNEDGSPVIDFESEMQVSSAINNVNLLSKEFGGKLALLQEQHKKEYQSSLEGLKNLKQEFFSAFSDESKLPPAVKADIQAAKDGVGKIPAFKNHPAMELLVLSYAALKAQNRQILTMAQMLNKEADKLENVRRAGPGKLEFQAGEVKGEKVFSEDDF